MSDLTYYQRNRRVILNKAKDYYENKKKKIKRANIETYLKKKNMEKK